MAHALIKLKKHPTLLNKLYMPIVRANGKAGLIKTKAGVDSMNLIRLECIAQRANKRLNGDLSMKIDLCIRAKKKEPDADAIFKLLLDSLEGVVYENDKQIVFLQLAKHRNQEIDEVIILVEELN